MELLNIMILYPEIKVLERFQKFRHRMQVTASFFYFWGCFDACVRPPFSPSHFHTELMTVVS